jgi:hypothetical protein
MAPPQKLESKLENAWIVDAELELPSLRKASRSFHNHVESSSERTILSDGTVIPIYAAPLEPTYLPTASVSSIAKYAGLFLQFAKLPQDIRLLVYKECLWTAPRVFDINVCSQDSLRVRSSFPSPLLHLNWESRQEFLRCYKIFYGKEMDKKAKFYDVPVLKRIAFTSKLFEDFNPEQDTLRSKLPDFVAHSAALGAEKLYYWLIHSDNVQFIMLDEVFVDPEDSDVVLRDIIPEYLWSNYLWRVQLGFHVPVSEKVSDWRLAVIQ